jgi:transposase-like protein
MSLHQKCPRCGSDVFYAYGRSKNGKQRYLCLVCNRQFVEGSVEVYRDRPLCPRCNGKMSIYKQEKDAVRFRCSSYPVCREYVKINKEKLTQ